MARDVEKAVEIRVNGVLPLLNANFFDKRRGARDSGIVHQQVHPRQGSKEFNKRLINRYRIGNVAVDRRVLTVTGTVVPKKLPVDIEYHDAVSLCP